MFIVINKEKVISYIFVLSVIIMLFCMGTYIKKEKVDSIQVNSDYVKNVQKEEKKSIN